MSNVRYLATLSSGTPAKRYARDINGNQWTHTKADAYRFTTVYEANLAAVAGANRYSATPHVQQAPIAPHKRQHRQTSS